MANRTILLCLTIVICSVTLTECRFGGSRSRGSSSRSRGSSSSSSSHNYGWGSSSSSRNHGYPSSSSGMSGYGKPSHGYPSSSSGMSGTGKQTNHGYPSSSSGMSGIGKHTSHGYPSSSSGMSGISKPTNYGYPSSSSGMSGIGKQTIHGYPSSSSGMSGISKPTNHGYPSSSSGMSGIGKPANHGYPTSSSGMSGTNKQNNHGYPTSFSGMSGSGISSKNPSYPSGTGTSGLGFGYTSVHGDQKHSYPKSGGASGAGTSNFSPPASTYHSSNGYNTNTNNHYHNHHTNVHNTFIPPTYYTAPQHVYVTQYRDSGSRYGDLLTGLTLYNMGRSHSHYHDHYYRDDYYHSRYNTPNSYSSPNSVYGTPKESASCRLKIKDNNSIETLNIPCEIVSTFTDGSKKVTTQNTTVCVTETTVKENVIYDNATLLNNKTTNENNNHTTTLGASTNETNILEKDKLSSNVLKNSTDNKAPNVLPDLNVTKIINAENVTLTNTTLIDNFNDSLLVQPIQSTKISSSNVTETTTLPAVPLLQAAINSSKPDVQATVKNVTQKCTTTINTIDPLTVKGPAVNPSGLLCIVEIRTKDSFLENKVDCDTLIKYAKMPEPKKQESSLMPSRSKLEAWRKSPPWWMSMFIAV